MTSLTRREDATVIYINYLSQHHHHLTAVRWVDKNNKLHEVVIKGKPTDLSGFKEMVKR